MTLANQFSPTSGFEPDIRELVRDARQKKKQVAQDTEKELFSWKANTLEEEETKKETEMSFKVIKNKNKKLHRLRSQKTGFCDAEYIDKNRDFVLESFNMEVHDCDETDGEN